MTPLLVGAAAAVTIGAGLQSATGFGFALVAAPLLFAALGPQQAIGTLLVLSVEASLLIIAGERRRPRPLGRDSAVIVAASLPGAIVGVAVLRSLDAATLQYTVTLGVIGALIVRWLSSRRSLRRRRSWWSAPAAGLAAGALTTATNTSGPPLLLHLTGRGTEPTRVRDTISTCYVGLSLVSAAALWITHTSGAIPDPAALAALIPLVALGHLAGRPLFSRLAGGSHYETSLTVILVIAVATGLVTTVL
ncbi:MAG TPA: TSUP family transporter [Kribbella sp.]|nr:TSUP family transporter [Kribbella sp.]